MRSGWKTVGVLTLAGVALGCGSSSAPAAPVLPTSGFFITISNLTYSPSSLHAPPGATVTVVNLDSTPHSVTSESTANAFTPGSVSGIAFDTGAFTGGSVGFTLPANAPNGTVIPFYCTVHLSMMSPANGSITIDTSAQPTAPPLG